jgi:hypothetical protein
MPRGLKLPVGVDGTGGTAMVDGEEENRKIIWSALSDCDNDNAFQQDLGLGSSMVFGIKDAGVRARILDRVTDIFRIFEALQRFRLKRESVAWRKADGELILEFKYLDLESDEEQSFSRAFRTG